jgi:hypothetical protein
LLAASLAGSLAFIVKPSLLLSSQFEVNLIFMDKDKPFVNALKGIAITNITEVGILIIIVSIHILRS